MTTFEGADNLALPPVEDFTACDLFVFVSVFTFAVVVNIPVASFLTFLCVVAIEHCGATTSLFVRESFALEAASVVAATLVCFTEGVLLLPAGFIATSFISCFTRAAECCGSVDEVEADEDIVVVTTDFVWDFW